MFLIGKQKVKDNNETIKIGFRGRGTKESRREVEKDINCFAEKVE